MSTGESHATSFADDIKIYTLHDASFADGIIACLEFESLDKNLTILRTTVTTVAARTPTVNGSSGNDKNITRLQAIAYLLKPMCVLHMTTGNRPS
jgi:hypothetical protein